MYSGFYSVTKYWSCSFAMTWIWLSAMISVLFINSYIVVFRICIIYSSLFHFVTLYSPSSQVRSKTDCNSNFSSCKPHTNATVSVQLILFQQGHVKSPACYRTSRLLYFLHQSFYNESYSETPGAGLSWSHLHRQAINIIRFNTVTFDALHDQFCHLPLASSFLWCTDTKDSWSLQNIRHLFHLFVCQNPWFLYNPSTKISSSYTFWWIFW